MSLGVNLLMDLCSQAAGFWGDAVDIEIVEEHHNKKADSPSGTAISLAEVINKSYDNQMQVVCGRSGFVGQRPRKEIGVHAVRGGNIVGNHRVMFITDDEVMEFVHMPQSKNVFAAGALRAARYMADKPAGMYSMTDIVMEMRTVTGVTYSENEAMITLEGLPAGPETMPSLFERVAKERINVDIITQTPPHDGTVDVSFSLPGHEIRKAVAALEDLHAQIFPVTGLGKVTVEGVGMERQHGIAAKLFAAIAAEGITIHIVTTSETKISFLVERNLLEQAVAAVRKEFGI